MAELLCKLLEEIACLIRVRERSGGVGDRDGREEGVRTSKYVAVAWYRAIKPVLLVALGWVLALLLGPTVVHLMTGGR